jgi:hypothetical protein
MFTMTVTMKAWFRAIASAFKSEATALGFAGVFEITCLDRFRSDIH